MKNKIKIVIIIFVSVIVGIAIEKIILSNSESNVTNFATTKKGTFTNRLSMMLENESGQYVATTAEAWPTTGYKFNSKLSKCANGGKVSWDFANKRVKMEGTTSDKCFIYFDKMVTVDSYCEDGDNLADCIKTYGNQGYEKSSIYIHDSNLTNGAGDGSYRFAGASDNVNNFVCFGSDASTCPIDNLYRIIGVFGDQVKLIKYDYATSALLGTDGDYYGAYTPTATGLYKGAHVISDLKSYYWNYKNNTSINDGKGSNIWSTSLLNTTNLNTNFLNNLGNNYSNMIATTAWKVGGNTWSNMCYIPAYQIYQNEIVSPAETTTVSAKIGLMYASDYGYAINQNYWAKNLLSRDKKDYRLLTTENWIYMGLDEWIITRTSNNYYQTFLLRAEGYLSNYVISEEDCLVRPTFYLKSSINYVSGKGTKENPIRVENSEVTLADYVKSKYTGTQGTNGVYLHNSTLTNGAGDNSYRYAGANPNNYVCFGSDASTCPADNLYRIIGVFGDRVKLIKADYATSTALGTDGAYISSTYSPSSYSSYKGSLTSINRYYWNANTKNNKWSVSDLNTVNLNINYISYLGTTWANKIATTTWKVGGNTYNNIMYSAMNTAYQNEIVSPAESTTNSAKIGLMYVSDYGYAASPSYWTYKGYDTATTDYRAAISANWMYMGLNEWAISRGSDTTGNAFFVSYNGSIGRGSVYGEGSYGIRPTFYLNSDVIYTGVGNGSSGSPYRIS